VLFSLLAFLAPMNKKMNLSSEIAVKNVQLQKMLLADIDWK
jgi:hypothetical protein